MAVVTGQHPPATGDPPNLFSGKNAYDGPMPSEYKRWEIPLAGTNQAAEGIMPEDAPLEWAIRGITVVNNSTKTFQFKWGFETALGDLGTEADYIVDPYKMVNFPCWKQRIDTVSYSIVGPQTVTPGDILVVLVPVYLPASSYDIAPSSGNANSIEVHANTALANNGDTGVIAFTNPITSVTLAADFATQNVPDTSAMSFYVGRDANTMTGPIVVLGGEKFSLAGTIGAYRVVNVSGVTGGYRVIGLFSQ